MSAEIMRSDPRAQRLFVWLWLAVTAIKLWAAARLPLFVDEAFYWQEGQHLAWAYSDLPGITAWLCRLGVALGGNHVLALRAPFLLIGALLPWWLVRIAARQLAAEGRDGNEAWRVGLLAVLMPLPAMLGIMALPDVPMALATVMCLDAIARGLRAIETPVLVELGLGLVIGAFSHYRFAGVIAVGLIALLMLPAGRGLLREPRLWLAVLPGALAWWPLCSWNLHHADAGLRFQLLERNPWRFQWTGVEFVVLQAGMATPLLLWAMAQSAWCARRLGTTAAPAWRWFALFGGGSTLGYFLLGFFADSERVSFHWTLPGFLALLLVLPRQLRAWTPTWRRLAWACVALGCASALGYCLSLSVPGVRALPGARKYYPYNFSGWSELAQAVREARAEMPADTRLLAGDFKLGAELGFALDDADIAVLEHPLNRKHGRAGQLQSWQLQSDGSRRVPTLLVVGSGEVKFRALVDYYQGLCARVGALPPPQVVSVDHGAQRYLLFRLPSARAGGACVTPAQAYFDAPRDDAEVGPEFAVSGWAIKDQVGVRGVTLTLDGKPVAEARYGDENTLPRAFYQGRSRDPHLAVDASARVGFHALVDASDFAPGTHWLGMVVHGNDGSDETWEGRAIRIAR